MRWRLYTTTHRGVAVYDELRSLVPRSDAIDVVTAIPHRIEPDYRPVLESAVARGADTLTYADAGLPVAGRTLASNWRRKLPVGGETFIIHDSLLPRLRGFSPLVNALLQGDATIGATLFRAVEEIDAGPILLQREFPVPRAMPIGDVLAEMTRAYLDILRTIVPMWVAGTNVPEREQNHADATASPKIDWAEAPRIDPVWDRSRIENHIRVFQPPFPQAYTVVNGTRRLISSLEDFETVTI